jgi:carboxymethylenebutenolidase
MLALLALAVAPASLAGTSVSFPSSPGNASGYLALPASAGKHPAVILVHEWWGLNDWVKEQADRFAAQGYVALAVDLYRGKATADPAEAHELMRGMPEDRANADLVAAFKYLAKRKDVNAKRIGSIGWCMGGGYSLSLAMNEPKLAACVVNYGHLMTDPKNIARIHAPILGNFGGKDRGIPPADVEAFRDAMVKAGKSIDVKIYANSGHAFMNPNNKEGYVAVDAADAQKRIDAFLTAKLR